MTPWENLSRLLERVGRVFGELPGVATAQSVLETVERELVRALKERLDRVDGEHDDAIAGRTAPHAAEPERDRPPVTPAMLLSELLSRSMDQTPDECRRDVFVHLLRELVPDEARILAALSDGSAYPLVHVGHGPRLGPLTQRVLDNASSVGKAAGVAWPDAVPRYVSHLRELGLVETDHEDAALQVQYEILETDTAVRDAIRRITEDRRSARIVRRTLRIAPLGRALWHACATEEIDLRKP